MTPWCTLVICVVCAARAARDVCLMFLLGLTFVILSIKLILWPCQNQDEVNQTNSVSILSVKTVKRLVRLVLVPETALPQCS